MSSRTRMSKKNVVTRVYDREMYVELDRLKFMRMFLGQINYNQRSTDELYWPPSRGEILNLPNALLTGYLGEMRLGMRESVVVKVFRAITDSGTYDAIALYVRNYDSSQTHGAYIHLCFLRDNSVEEILLLEDDNAVPVDVMGRPQLPLVFFRYFDIDLLSKRMGEQWACDTLLYRYVFPRMPKNVSGEVYKPYEEMLYGQADWRMWSKFMGWCDHDDIRAVNKKLRALRKGRVVH